MSDNISNGLPSILRDLRQHQRLWRLEQKMQDTEVITSSSPNSDTRIRVTVLLYLGNISQIFVIP